MTAIVLAEAGLSECVRAGTCPEFGRGLATILVQWSLIGALVLVWLIGAQVATAGVCDAEIGVARTVAWVLVVWLLPLIGLMAWFLWSRRRLAGSRRHPQRGSLSTGGPSSG